MATTIRGSAALVVKRLNATNGMVVDSFQRGLARGLLGAAGIAQREFLSGPRPEKLDIRTRRLRDSISTEVERAGDGVIGRIGSNVKYAAFHEFGFHGTENVRAHTRVLGHFAGGRSVPTKQPVSDRSGKTAFYQDVRPGYVRMGLSDFKGLATVKEHTRRVDYAGRPFIAPALEKALPMITGQINQELNNLANGS